MRILLVEDDPDLSRQLKLALADAGYAVDHAPDGEEAQFLGETEPYDAVILDLGLPKVDGVSVLERPRRLEREGGGLRRRRRRLPDQAVPHRGVAGPAARPAAPLGRPRRAEPGLRGLAARSARGAGQRQWRAPAADLAGVPPAALPDDAPG